MSRLEVVFVSDADSWIEGHLNPISDRIAAQRPMRITRTHTHEAKDQQGDVRIILSYSRIIPAENLARFRHNLVVHQSALPQGRGMSPLTWQVLAGKNQIPTTLFEAAPGCDTGPIYLQEEMKLEGHELIDEMRAKQVELIANLLEAFFKKYPLPSRPQSGEASTYRKRTPKDSALDVNRSIQEQFNLLRICDNERYPAYFDHLGHRYILKIYKESGELK